jgi:hypothetical protein
MPKEKHHRVRKRVWNSGKHKYGVDTDSDSRGSETCSLSDCKGDDIIEIGETRDSDAKARDENIGRRDTPGRIETFSDLSKSSIESDEHPEYGGESRIRVQPDRESVTAKERHKEDTTSIEVDELTALLSKWNQRRDRKASSHGIPGTPTKKNPLRFKRVDEIHDERSRSWKLVEGSCARDVEFDCVFLIRRSFDINGSLKGTYIDIQSKPLHKSLQELFRDDLGLGLLRKVPGVSSRSLFHGYDEIKDYIDTTLQRRLEKAETSKEKSYVKEQIAQCKLLLSYIDEDFMAVKAKLEAMLTAGVITYDLVWALFKPGSIAITSTHEGKGEPRCFQVSHSCEYQERERGLEAYVVNGRYLENDGVRFGMTDVQATVQLFTGQKRITSLDVYPLDCHKHTEVSV